MQLKMFATIAAISAVLNANGMIHAANLVTNGGFEGPFGDPNYHIKERFSEIKPYGWSGGDKLTYLCFPGSATVVDNNGGLAVWNSPGNQSPAGGNFVIGDGDPNFSDPIYQVLNNLVVGQAYQVSFYQAAGQNHDRIGATWEQWKVGFGNSTQLSSLMTTPSQGTSPWELQVLNFIADSTSEKLSFLAYGGPGGAPPVSFLDGVNVQPYPGPGPGPNTVPEPSSIALSAVGLLVFGALAVRRLFKY